MHYTKRCLSITAAAIIPLNALCMTQYIANAEEAPTDIHLTVETKDIDIEDIPADRTVSLNIWLENCPPFNTLTFGIIKDPRLEFFNDMQCFETAEGVSQASMTFGRKNLSEPDYMLCPISSLADDSSRVHYENAIVKVKFVLPEQVAAGDFFSVELPRQFGRDTVSVSLSQEISDCFEDAPFTQLNSGGIRITQRNQPPPSNGSSGNNSGGESQDSGGGGAVPQTGGGNEPVPSQDNGNTNSPAPAETAAAETVTATETQTTGTTSSETTTTTEKTTETTTTTESSSTTASESTSIKVTTGAPEEPEKKNTGGLKTIGIITLVIAAVCSVFILAARLRMK